MRQNGGRRPILSGFFVSLTDHCSFLQTTKPRFMTPAAVIATVLGYIAVLFAVAWISGRRADNAGFFTGNRRTPWYMAAFAMIGAAISGVTFISVPGSVSVDAFSYMQMVLGFTVGQFIVAFVLIPLFYRLRSTLTAASASPRTVQEPGSSSSRRSSAPHCASMSSAPCCSCSSLIASDSPSGATPLSRCSSSGSIRSREASSR